MPDPRPLRVGDLIRDNDPRTPGRVLRVVDMDFDRFPILHVVACADGYWRRVRIRLDRIHTDGRPRRSGWSLVT